MQNLPLEEAGAKAEAEAKRVERIAALNIVGSIYYVTSNNTKVGTQSFPSTFRVVAYAAVQIRTVLRECAWRQYK